MSESNDSGTGCLIIIFLVLIALWSFDTGPFSEETTVYLMRCADSNDGTCNKWEYTEPVTFTIVKSKQVVIKEVEGLNKFLSLENCSVKNRSNWTCEEMGVEISIVDGDYYVGGISMDNQPYMKQSSLTYFMIDKYFN